LTVIVQLEAPAATLTPLPATVNEPAPAVAVMVGVPPQLFTTDGVAAITSPDGNVSVNVIPDCANAPAEFVNVNVSVEGRLTPTVAGLNALVSVGWVETVSVLLTPEASTTAVAPVTFVFGLA
jgi:hypothetical protein